MNKTLIALTFAGALAGLGAWRADACTSMIFKAEDGTRIYARTMEWGASDLKSEMMLVPRSMSFSSALGDGKTGARWTNQYGFVGVNAAGLAYATDGMNEAGLDRRRALLSRLRQIRGAERRRIGDDGQQCRSRQLHPEQLQDRG